MKKEKPKKTIHALDCYVIYCLAFISIYTIAHTIIFAITGIEAKVLDVLVFGAFSGEIVQCYFLKKGKLQKEAEIIFKQKKQEPDLSDVDEPYTDDM